MKIAVLLLAIIGSILAIALGACAGVCLSGLGDLADDGGKGAEQGSMLLVYGIVQALLGLVVGIMAYNKMNKGIKLNLFEKLGLFVAGAFSITNTFVLVSGGACHIIAGIIVVMYKPDSKKQTGEPSK